MESILSTFGGASKAVESLVKVVVIGVIIYLAVKAFDKFKRRNAGKAWVDKSNLDPNKNYQSYAKAVKEAFDKWVIFQSGSEMDNICKSILLLSDNEIKEVSNQYLSLYGNGTRNIQDEISDAFCIGCSNCDTLIDRLQKLGIN